MSKRGKYETVPVTAPKTNSNLLKAYLMSLVSLVITCAMFMGTTAAWFTVEVTNAGNRIQVGVLSVDLFHGVQNGDQTQWISLKTDTTHKVFDGSDQIWKPGSTDVQVLKVINDGQMQLDYQVTVFADLASSKDQNGVGLTQESLDSLSQHFMVYCAPGENREFDAEKWQLIGTLYEVIQGKPIHTGALEEDAEAIFSVAIAMDTDVDSSFMGHTLELYLKLDAYQGNESFIPVSGEASLRKALLTGGEILLLEDVTFDEPMTVASDAVIVFNGKSLTFAHTQQEAQYAFRVNNGAHLTLDAEGSTVNVQNGLVFVPENTNASVTLCGGTYLTPGATGENSGLIHIPNGESVQLELVMENVTYNKEQSGWLVRFGDGVGGKMKLVMTDCTVSAGHGIRTAPAGTVEITDSSIHAVQGLAIHALTEDGVNVTNSQLSADYPGTALNATAYIYTVATENGGTAEITGGSVVCGDAMYALAVLTDGGNITAEGCGEVDETVILTHKDAAGTITLN